MTKPQLSCYFLFTYCILSFAWAQLLEAGPPQTLGLGRLQDITLNESGDRAAALTPRGVVLWNVADLEPERLLDFSAFQQPIMTERAALDDAQGLELIERKIPFAFYDTDSRDYHSTDTYAHDFTSVGYDASGQYLLALNSLGTALYADANAREWLGFSYDLDALPDAQALTVGQLKTWFSEAVTTGVVGQPEHRLSSVDARYNARVSEADGSLYIELAVGGSSGQVIREVSLGEPGEGPGYVAMGFSPDGRWFALLTANDELFLWWVESEPREGKRPQPMVYLRAFSNLPDVFNLRDAPEPRYEYYSLPPEGATTGSVTVTPGTSPGAELLSVSRGGERLFDINGSLASPPVFSDVTSALYLLLWGRDDTGPSLAAYALDGEELFSVGLESSLHRRKVALSGGGQTLILAERYGRGPEAFMPVHTDVTLYDALTGTPLGTLDGHNDYIPIITSAPDGQLLAAGVWEGIELWNVSTGQLERRLRGAEGLVEDVTFSRDARTVAARDGVGGAYVWDLETSSLVVAPFKVGAMTLEPSGDNLVLVTEESGAYQWDWRSGVLSPLFEGETSYQVAYSPNGRYLAVVGESGTRVWDVAAQRFTAQVADAYRYFGKLTFSPDSRYLALWWSLTDYVWEWHDPENLVEVLVLDVVTGEVAASVPHHFDVETAGFGEGRYVLSLGEKGLLAFDMSTRRFDFRVTSLRANATDASVEAATFISGLSLISLLTLNGEFMVCSYNVLAQLFSLYYNLAETCAVAEGSALRQTWNLTSSPDGTWVAARQTGGIIQVWRLE